MNLRNARATGVTLAVLLPVLALSLPTLLAADVFTLDVHAINAGSATTIGNSCSRLDGSIGQPAPGFSSGSGGFGLAAGFWAAVAVSGGDDLFFDGFEGCKP